MTDHTDEELIALAKKCGAYNGTARTSDGELLYYITTPQLIAFASALRQQDLARMARMREALRKIQSWDMLNPPRNDMIGDAQWLRELVDNALSETSDIQEWMDGQRAQWQPIETAPKERNVDVWLQSDSNPDFGTRITNVVYVDGKWIGIPQHWQLSYVRPTYWMPLPAAPSARSTKGEG